MRRAFGSVERDHRQRRGVGWPRRGKEDRVRRGVSRPSRRINRGRFTAVLALLLLALALIGFAATNLFVFALACLLITGFAVIVIGVGEQTLLQNAVDPAMRGRVMSLYGMIGRGAPAIGAIVMGSLAEVLGFQAPVLGGAILLLVLWWWAGQRQRGMAGTLEGKRPT